MTTAVLDVGRQSLICAIPFFVKELKELDDGFSETELFMLCILFLRASQKEKTQLVCAYLPLLSRMPIYL